MNSAPYNERPGEALAILIAGRSSVAGFVAFWQSFPSRWERTALGLLILICLTVIFSTALVQTLVVALALFVLFWNAFDRPRVFRHTPLDLPYLVFIAGRVLSILFSRQPELSLSALHIEFFYYVVFFLVTQSVLRNELPTASVLVSVLVSAGAIAGLLGSLKVFFGIELRASSSTAGVYTLGGYLCAVLPLALLRSSIVNQEGRGWWDWFAPLAICSGIIMTQDRLHWAGLAIILAVAAFASQRRRLIVVLVTGLCLSLCIPSVWLRLERMVQYGDFTAGREVIWAGAWQLIAVHPIVGFGPRTFAVIFPLMEKLPYHGVGSWHNDYLQVYMESGLVGLLPLLWIIGATYVYGVRALRRSHASPEERRLILSLFASLSALFLLGGVLDTHIGLVFRMLLGLFAVIVSRLDEGRLKQDVPLNGIRSKNLSPN